MGALHADDARILAQRFGQLASAHVDGIDTHRTALQEAVGEAARGGADVEADPLGRVDPEGIEGAGQLLAAPGHEARCLIEADLDVDGHRCLAGSTVTPCSIADADTDVAGQQQGLGRDYESAPGHARR